MTISTTLVRALLTGLLMISGAASAQPAFPNKEIGNLISPARAYEPGAAQSA